MDTGTIQPDFRLQIINLISECINAVKVRQPIGADDLLNEAKAAEVLGLAKGTLNIWRHEGKGPKYHKLESAIRYKYSDLLDFVNRGSVRAGA